MASTSRLVIPIVVLVIAASAISTVVDVFFTSQDAAVTPPAAPPAGGKKGPLPAGAWPYLRDNAKSATTLDEMMQANYYLVVDGSGSMGESECSAGETKMQAAKKAVTAFGNAVPANANLGLTTFSNDGMAEKVPLGINNRAEFTRQINALYAGGNTPLRSAIKMAYDRLTEQARNQLGYGEYHLVVITDGEASLGEDPTSVVSQIINASPVVIHTIGFCIDQDHSLNQVGRTYYQSATDPVSLAKGLAGVLAEAPQFNATQFK